MSRIDQALRRAGISPAGSRYRHQEAFDSPWQVADSEQERSVSPSPSSAAGHSARDDRKGSALLADTPVKSFQTDWKEWLAPAESDPSIGEQFRRLAAALLHAQRGNRLRTILVTSAAPGEGKTLTALNLGLVLADSYKRRVLLVDADLRRPRLSEAAHFYGDVTLGDALKSPDVRKVSLVQLTDTLTLLPAGAPDPNPLSGLTSPRMGELLEEAGGRFDWVIVDTPPVGACADAGLLCSMVDATVFVVRAGVTPYDAVQSAVEALTRERIFGVVLNGVEQRTAHPYGGYSTPELVGTP